MGGGLGEFYLWGNSSKNSDGRGTDKGDHYGCIGSRAYEKKILCISYI